VYMVLYSHRLPLEKQSAKGYNNLDGAAQPLCRCALTFVGAWELALSCTAVLFYVKIIAYVRTHILDLLLLVMYT